MMKTDIEVCRCDGRKDPQEIITKGHIEQLQGYSIEQVQVKLAEVYNLLQFDINLKQGAILDSYVSAYWFGLESNFPVSSIAFFLNILHAILAECEKGSNLEESVTHLKSFFHPSLSSLVTNEDSKKIIDYLMESLFQHYKLYQCLFHEKQQQRLLTQQVLVESLPVPSNFNPAPLEEAMPEYLYIKYIAPPIQTKISTDSSEPKVETTPTECQSNDTTLCDECNAEPAAVHGNLESIEEDLQQLLKSMSADEIAAVVGSLAHERLQPLKVEMETKLQEREAILLSKMKKFQSH